MKRAIIGFGLFATATVFPLQAQSPAPPREPERVRLAYKDADLVDILQFYAHLTKRKVWIEPGLQLRVSVMTSRDVPRAEALSLIRGTLLTQGVELREVGEGEVFVSRTSDPRIQALLPTPGPSGTPHVRGLVPRLSPSPPSI